MFQRLFWNLYALLTGEDCSRFDGAYFFWLKGASTTELVMYSDENGNVVFFGMLLSQLNWEQDSRKYTSSEFACS